MKDSARVDYVEVARTKSARCSMFSGKVLDAVTVVRSQPLTQRDARLNLGCMLVGKLVFSLSAKGHSSRRRR